MGGVNTEVSIVRYSAVSDSQTNKTFEHIEILAEAFLKDLGGFNLDLILVDMLAERFNALKERKGKPDVRSNDKVVKRMLKEVVKIKDILSANKNTQVKLGELLDYVTLQTTIERKEFEDASKEFFDRVLIPVDEALKKAGLAIE